MTCPKCRAKHAAGPCPPAGHDMDFVTIYETSDSSLLPVIESLLEGAEIPFVVQGEEALGVLPVGGFGSGGPMHGVGARVLVPVEDEEAARALLERIDEPDFSEE